MDPEVIEVHNEDDHARGFLRPRLLHALEVLRVVAAASNCTLCTIHIDLCVKMLPMPNNPKSLSPT